MKLDTAGMRRCDEPERPVWPHAYRRRLKALLTVADPATHRTSAEARNRVRLAEAEALTRPA